jgi:aspartyl-tRNA(Asn)/glutamyl-tRNA(Gln) amidotransferase subunit A
MVFTLKDVIATAGVRTTDGANFGERVPEEDAAIVKSLLRAGAIVVGKANLHEFAYGGTSQNPFWGSCRNPWDIDRIPGGSSGGSATAVAAGMCHVSIGTDTGGSGRLPAALTGVCGLRPTPGWISCTGITPLSPFFDTVSPLARRVSDIARTFVSIAGYDPADPHSVDRPVDLLLSGVWAGIKGLRIGVPQGSFFVDGLDPGVAVSISDAMRTLEHLGATLVDVRIPHIEEAAGHFEKLFHTDGAAVHAERLRTAPERFGGDIRERLEKLGGKVSGTDYAAALQWAAEWRRQLQPVLSSVDAIAHASAPGVAPLVADCGSTTTTTRRLAVFCYPWALACIPALSIPCGFAEHGMPCGLTIAASPWQDGMVLRVGEAFQQSTEWHLHEPEIVRELVR